MKWLIAVAVVAGIGAIAGTVYVGSQVREETVVARPYEEGLGSDAEREARQRLGWTIEVPAAPVAPGALAFTIRDRAGAPLEGAAIAVEASRAETSRGKLRAEARAEGAGRYAVDLPFTAAGRWDVRFDVSRGADRLRITRPVTVGGASPDAAGAGACQLSAGPCRLALEDGLVLALDLAPRPPRTMAELALTAGLTRDGAPVDGAALEVALAMVGMDMGRNVARLAPAGPGRYAGTAVLVRCPSGRRDWTARVAIALPGGATRAAEVAIEVAE